MDERTLLALVDAFSTSLGVSHSAARDRGPCDDDQCPGHSVTQTAFEEKRPALRDNQVPERIVQLPFLL